MSNKDRDFYEIKWRFGSKNQHPTFIPLFIITLREEIPSIFPKFTINDETDERTY